MYYLSALASSTLTTLKIQESCPKCGNSEMRFTTLQLRSADEGSTGIVAVMYILASANAFKFSIPAPDASTFTVYEIYPF